MMIPMQDPQKTMHYIFMRAPSDTLHQQESSE
jgi:hypothetical protein